MNKLFWICVVLAICGIGWLAVYQFMHPDMTQMRVIFNNWGVLIVSFLFCGAAALLVKFTDE